MVYDDGEEEWLSLPKHAFRWLAPRARSAGCSEPLKRALCTLGAQGEMLVLQLASHVLQLASHWALLAEGEVAAQENGHNTRTKNDVARDLTTHTLNSYTPLIAGIIEEQLTPPGEGAAGPPQHLPDGALPPAGQAAVGQRVAVWCPGDGEFYT